MSTKGRLRRRPSLLSVGLLGHFKSVVHLDTQVAYGAFKLSMSEQELDGPQVLRASVDQRRLSSAHGMRAIGGGVEPYLVEPLMNDARVLPGGDVRRVGDPAGEQII